MLYIVQKVQNLQLIKHAVVRYKNFCVTFTCVKPETKTVLVKNEIT